MRNIAKDELRRLVLRDVPFKRLKDMGFKETTIRKYYRALRPKE